MSKVLKRNEPSFVQEALTKGRVCHELCCVPRGRRLTRNKALPSRLRLNKGSFDLSRCRRCLLREMKTSGRCGGWRWWPRWQVWVWRRTECGKGIVESMPGSVYGFSNARTMWREGKFGGLFRIKFRGTLYVPMKALEHYFIGNRRHKEY